MANLLRQSGQSMMEVVVALAIFALIAAALVSLGLGSFSALGQGSDYLAAAALADEKLAMARAARDGAWNDFISNQNEVLGSFTSDTAFAPVCRAASGDLVDCPAGQIDLHSQLATVVVSWPAASGVTNQVTRATLFTNWDSRDWSQTDWSGGPGQNEWQDETRYASDDGHLNRAAGELKLAARPLTWSAPGSPVTQNLNDVHCVSEDYCWAVGNVVTTGQPSGRGELILRWDGATWSRLGPSALLPNTNLNSVFCASENDCWAVGSPSSGVLILYYSGGDSWSRHAVLGAVPSVALNSVFCAATNDCWAVGNASGGASGGELILHWNGGTWSRVNPSSTIPNVTLNSVHCAATDNCFAAGANGVIIRWNGTSWALSADTGTQTWQAIFVVAAEDAFVVGNLGAIRRFDGSDWGTTYSTLGENWFGLGLTSASNGIVVGAAGASRHFDGGQWNPLTTDINNNLALNSFFFSSPNTGWAVGERGTILYLSGGGYELAGELVSSAFNLGDPSPVQIIDWDETASACPTCLIRFQLRTAASQAALNATPWSNDFTSAAGTIINPSYNGGQWVQYRVQLTGDGDSTPVLEEVRINYK